MNRKLYGIDPKKEITPNKVRDAIIQCFKEAHSDVLEELKEVQDFKSDEDFEEMKQINVKLLVNSKLNEIGADYDNPTKEDLIKLCGKLAEYAGNFRDKKTIKKDLARMVKIIELL